MMLMYLIGTQSTSISGALSILQFLCFLFYLNFFVLLVLCAAYAFLIFYEKQRTMTLYILGGCTAGALLMALLSFSAINAISQMLSGNFMAMLTYSGSAPGTWLVLMFILQTVCGGLAAYLRFIKKAEEISQEDLSQMQDTAKQMGAAAASAARKAAEGVGSESVKLSKKFKDYYATEKGKRNVRIAGIAAAAVLVLIIAVSIWSATRTTPIDLTGGCEVTFVGYDGEGEAYVDCDVDYDINNPEVASFVYDVEYTVENDGQLSNGDQVILRAEYSETTAKSLKLGVENAEKELTVEGLTTVYRSFEDIPSEISSGFEAAAQEALKAEIMEEEGKSYGPDSITINSCDNIGVYYEYSSWGGEGTVYYLYRVDVTQEDSYATERLVDYYYVSIDPISEEYTLDLTPESDDLYVSDIYLYQEEKTDALAKQSFTRYMGELQTVSENLSDQTYQDTRTEKE